MGLGSYRTRGTSQAGPFYPTDALVGTDPRLLVPQQWLGKTPPCFARLKTWWFNPSLRALPLKPAPDLQEHTAAHLRAALFPSWAPARAFVTTFSSPGRKVLQSTFTFCIICWGRKPSSATAWWLNTGFTGCITDLQQEQVRKKKSPLRWQILAFCSCAWGMPLLALPLPSLSPECLHLPPHPKHRWVSSELPNTTARSFHWTPPPPVPQWGQSGLQLWSPLHS